MLKPRLSVLRLIIAPGPDQLASDRATAAYLSDQRSSFKPRSACSSKISINQGSHTLFVLFVCFASQSTTVQ